MSLRKMATAVFGEAVTGGQIAFFTLALGAAVYFPTKVSACIGFLPGDLEHRLVPQKYAYRYRYACHAL